MVQGQLLHSQAVAMVVVIGAFLMSRLRLCSASLEPNPLQLLPRSVADLQRQHNLNLIYNSTDAECIAMLRMRKAHFFYLVSVI
jgi:hypothetical protein